MSNTIFGCTTATPIDPKLIGGGGDITREEFDSAIGDIETALDSIITIQNELIGGDRV